MNKFKVLHLILDGTSDHFDKLETMQKPQVKYVNCKAFLCNSDGSCKDDNTSATMLQAIHYYDLIMSSTEVLLFAGSASEITDILIPAITKQPNWSNCLERRHVSSKYYINMYTISNYVYAKMFYMCHSVYF